MTGLFYFFGKIDQKRLLFYYQELIESILYLLFKEFFLFYF